MKRFDEKKAKMKKAELKFLSSLRRVHSKLANNQLNDHNSKILIIPGEIDFMIAKSSSSSSSSYTSNENTANGNSEKSYEFFNAEPYTQVKVPNWLVEGYETIELKDAVHLIRQWSMKSSPPVKNFVGGNFQFTTNTQRNQSHRNNPRCTARSSIRISAGGISQTRYHSLLLPRVVKSCMTFHSPTDKPCLNETESNLEAQRITTETELPLSQKLSQIFTATRSTLTSTIPMKKIETPTASLKTRQAKENFSKKYILHGKKLSNNGMRKLRKSLKQKVRKICNNSTTKNDGIKLTLKYVCSKQMVDGRSEIHCYTNENNGEYNNWTDDLDNKVIFEKILRKLFDSNGSGISFKIEKLKETKGHTSSSNVCCRRRPARSNTSSTIALHGSQNHMKFLAKDKFEECTRLDHIYDNEPQHLPSSNHSLCIKDCISDKPLSTIEHNYPTRHTSKCQNSTKFPKHYDNTNIINSFCQNISLDSLEHNYVCSALMATHHPHSIHHTQKCQQSQQILQALYQQQNQPKTEDFTTSYLESFNCMDDKPMVSTTKEYTISTPDNCDLPPAVSIPDLFNNNNTNHLDDIRSNDVEYIRTNRCLYSAVNTQPEHIYNIVGSLLNNQEKKIKQNGKRRSNYF